VEYEDRVTIATPEGVDLELVLAGLGSRFVAALVDWIIRFTLLVALAVVFLGADFAGGGIGTALYVLTSFLVFFGYDILFEVFASGRTPGKRWNGLRVVRVSGHPVGFLTSTIRNILRLVDILPFAYVVGCISVLATAKNQRLGDLAAGTLVVRDQRARGRDALEPAWPPRRAPDADALARWDVSAVTAEELAAVRRFLERRHELTPAARAQLGSTLTARLRPKVAGAPDGLAGEPFLESLAAAKAARR